MQPYQKHYREWFLPSPIICNIKSGCLAKRAELRRRVNRFSSMAVPAKWEHETGLRASYLNSS
jgi:hypothetical protein